MLTRAVQTPGTPTPPGAQAPASNLAGVLHLGKGNYDIAAQCLQAAAPSMPARPTLWLRWAECCVGAHAWRAAATLRGAEAVATGAGAYIVLPELQRSAKLMQCWMVEPPRLTRRLRQGWGPKGPRRC
jgi:hypothetical protein